MITVNSVYEICIPWNNQHNEWWNETCISVVEVYGLPGDRWTYHPHEDYMEFCFKSKKDYQLCKIMLSEKL